MSTKKIDNYHGISCRRADLLNSIGRGFESHSRVIITNQMEVDTPASNGWTDSSTINPLDEHYELRRRYKNQVLSAAGDYS